MKLEIGDKVWVTQRDGACRTGWYVFSLLSNQPSWEHEAGDWFAGASVKELKRALKQYPTICSGYCHIAEQLIATGEM